MNSEQKAQSLPSASLEQNGMLSAVFSKLPHDKIKINWNKNPIEMELFLSFLTVEVKRSTDHLGSCTGWTLLENNELKLKIGGGIVNGKEWLDSLQFGTKLNNKYNNYVNPFYLLGILTEEGKNFFIDYYKEDIDKIVSEQKDSINYLKRSLSEKQEQLKAMLSEIEWLSANSR